MKNIVSPEIKDLKSLIGFVLLNIKSIISITSIFIIFSIIYIFISDTYYESNITLYPAGELYQSFDLFEQYENIKEAFGIDLNNESNYYLPDIVVSNSLKREIVNHIPSM